jgi:hypothetical protein
MANEFKIKNGLYVSGSTQIIDNATITGSLTVLGGITGSMMGTASYALQALTASYSNNTTSASYANIATSASQALTSSYANDATSASYAFNATSASYAISASQAISALTASYAISASQAITASYANVATSASYANDATSASYAVSSSFTINALTASYAISASQAITASYANVTTSASYAYNATSASYAVSSSLTTNVVGVTNRILFNNATNTTTTSNNLTWEDSVNLMTLGDATGTAGTINKIALYTSSFGGYGFGISPAQLDYVSDGSHVFYKKGTTPTELVRIADNGNVTISGSLNVINGITGNLTGTASYATQALTASYSNNATSASYAFNATSASYAQIATSASHAPNAVSSSYAQTASFADNFTVAGILTAQTLVVQTISSSIIYSSGSNVFGNDLSNTQVFTGSVTITGSLSVNGSNVILTNQTSSMTVLSSSYALTASFASQALSASFASTTTSASYAATSSYASNFVIGSTLTLDGTLIDYATVNSSIVGSNNLFTLSTGSYRGAFYKYTLYNGVNARSGEVMAVWNEGNVQYTDVSTVDLGSTSPATASVSIVSAEAQLNFQTNTSGWTIKSTVTYI